MTITMYLPVDLIQHISIFCDTRTVLHITSLNHKTYEKIKIYFLDDPAYWKLTDNIIQSKKFTKLKKLVSNHKISNNGLKNLTNLEILHASDNCKIDDHGIRNLNLIELYVSKNPKITEVSHMTNLKILDAHGNCGIDDHGIRNLNLTELYSSGNSKITNA